MSIIPTQISLGFFLTALSKKNKDLQNLLAFRNSGLLECSRNSHKIAYEGSFSEPVISYSTSGCEENQSCNLVVLSSIFLTVFSSFCEITFSLAIFEVLSE